MQLDSKTCSVQVVECRLGCSGYYVELIEITVTRVQLFLL